MNTQSLNTRLRSTVAWVGWHTAELLVLTLPVVLAVTVTSWAWLLALAVAAGWVAHETHVHRRAHHQRRAVAAVNSTHEQQNQNITDSADETDRQEVRHA